MNPVFNKSERRLRAGLRIPVFLFFSFLAVGIGQSILETGVSYLFSILFSFGVLWLFMRFMDNRPDISIAGLGSDLQWIKECLIGSGVGMVSMSVIFIIQWLTGTITISGFGWEFYGEVHWLVPIGIGFIQMVSVGFYEEWMFRSYLLVNLKEGFSSDRFTPGKATITAVVFSSALFGLAHAFNDNATVVSVVNITFAGIMLAIPFVLTGRLSFSVGLHFAWNFFQGSIFGFRVSGLSVRNSLITIQQHGPDWWTGGSFGPEGGLLGLTMVVLISWFFIWYTNRGEEKLKLDTRFEKSYADLYNV